MPGISERGEQLPAVNKTAAWGAAHPDVGAFHSISINCRLGALQGKGLQGSLNSLFPRLSGIEPPTRDRGLSGWISKTRVPESIDRTERRPQTKPMPGLEEAAGELPPAF